MTKTPSWGEDDSILVVEFGFITLRVKARGVVTKTLNPGWIYVINGKVSTHDYDSGDDALRSGIAHVGRLLAEAQAAYNQYVGKGAA